MLKRTLDIVYRTSPRELVHALRAHGSTLRRRGHHKRAMEAEARLRNAMGRYTTAQLAGVALDEFTVHIRNALDQVDHTSEGYSDNELERQRDLSIRFHWGHNHDFGSFHVEGRMGDRHVTLLRDFVSLFPISLDDFGDKEVFDIGCWTGGTSLLLAALGSRVLAIEEVNKYAAMCGYLIHAFGLEGQVEVQARSLYSCRRADLRGRFDIVHFPGVVYHLSDPLIALRILYNALKIGGVVLVESAGLNRAEPVCRFDGSLVSSGGRREVLSRKGWNWFVPSPAALQRLMREAGFDEVETVWHSSSGRVFGFGRKVDNVSICRAGLSVPDID